MQGLPQYMGPEAEQGEDDAGFFLARSKLCNLSRCRRLREVPFFSTPQGPLS